MSEANARQVGGSHYRKGGLEHWDMMELNGIGYLESAATKYIVRSRHKGRLMEDLEKALHYTQKLMEMHQAGTRGPRGMVPTDQLQRFIMENACLPLEATAIWALCRWSTEGELRLAMSAIVRLIQYHRQLLEPSTPGTPDDGGHHSRQEDQS